MVFTTAHPSKKTSFEDALDQTRSGRYTAVMAACCCLLILAMYADIFGFSVVMPAAACDMQLTTSQQGLLSAMPLIGVMISSYAWGLSADTLGRRTTLLLAMPLGALLNVAATLAPTFASLAVLKFLSAGFTSSANAAGFVLMGESAPQRLRGRLMFLMASATMFVQLFICVFALPVFNLTFRLEIPWLQLTYRPWRLLMLIISLPGVIGVIVLVFLRESPKYLLSQGREEEAMGVLKIIHKWNTGGGAHTFPVSAVYLDEPAAPTSEGETLLRKVWNQTAPLFKPPLLKNSLKLYYLLLCAYMTSTGYTMWIPTMTNAYFDGEDKAGQTFCQVASKAATSNTTETDPKCNNTIQSLTLYAVICQSGAAGTFTILLSFLVSSIGKKWVTTMVFTISTTCGVALLFVRVPILSIILFYVFLYVSLILGNVNTYLVELNPTHLRGMATCLSVVVARGFGFASVQLIAELLADHCTPMISGYVVLVISGLIVSLFLPGEERKNKSMDKGVATVEANDGEKTRF